MLRSHGPVLGGALSEGPCSLKELQTPLTVKPRVVLKGFGVWEKRDRAGNVSKAPEKLALI